MHTITLFVISLGVALSSPVPPEKLKVLYDQRQEGDWNLNADFKNIVVMVIPSQPVSTPSADTVLDLLFKAIPKRSLTKKLHAKKKAKVPGEETMHFIESKTAPYHVDISRSKSHLAKLHPEVPSVVNAEEIVIANSPTVELVKDEPDHHHARIARAFLVTVPEDEFKKKEGKKKEFAKSVMKLLGAENEQCGPGLARDAEGVCRTVKN